jgi:hypothetical protein
MTERGPSGWRAFVAELWDWVSPGWDVFGQVSERQRQEAAEREAARAEVLNELQSDQALVNLDRPRQDAPISDVDDVRKHAAHYAPPTSRTSSADAGIGPYVFLVVVLVGVYLVWVIGVAWIVLSLVSGNVSTGVWIATVGVAAVLGIVAMYAAPALRVPDRFTMLWPIAVPALVELLVFGVLRPG